MKLSDAAGIATFVALGAIVAVGVLESSQKAVREVCQAGPTLVCDAIERTAAGRGTVRYRRVEVASELCGTETRPTKPRTGFELVPGSCVAAVDEAGTRSSDGGVKFLAQACACRAATGTCEYRNDAGTLTTAPQGRTLGPGYWPYDNFSGAGCVRKACVELMGETSWPTNCPGG